MAKASDKQRARQALAALKRHGKDPDPQLLDVVAGLKTMQDLVYQRACPRCSVILTYSNRDHLNAAVKVNGLCYTCNAETRPLPSLDARKKMSSSAYQRYGSIPGAKENIASALTTWARHVKKRDNYMCVICGSQDKLEAHHILAVSKHVDLALIENNGVTLCYDCHEYDHQINGCL